MFKHWKLIDWIIGGIVTVLFLCGPVWFFEHIPNIDSNMGSIRIYTVLYSISNILDNK